MKILHTGDCHLGCSLGSEKRFEEFDALLEHLVSVLREEEIGAVIIAGDVFDSHLPPNRAAEQYYRFLLQAARAGVTNIIVTGGNHDSAAYLEAPREILKYLSVHVFANASADCSQMVVELKNQDGSTAALVGAVPYLHERDLLVVEGGQSGMERESALRHAVLAYYRRMAETLEEINASVPHIVTGHLFVTEKQEKNDSWIGTLMSIAAAEFPGSVDYLALGHLHDAHTLKTDGKTCIRYSGAPLNVSFRELEVPKSLTVIDTDDMANIREIPLPSFQDMRLLKGSRQEIEKELEALCREDHPVWCSVENTGDYEPGLSEMLNTLIRGSSVKILFCRNRSDNPAVLGRLPEERHLADLAPAEVFKLLLKEHDISGDEADELLEAFKKIETSLCEDED